MHRVKDYQAVFYCICSKHRWQVTRDKSLPEADHQCISGLRKTSPFSCQQCDMSQKPPAHQKNKKTKTPQAAGIYSRDGSK